MMTDAQATVGFGMFTPFVDEKRLSEATRQLASRYLSGEIGRSVQPGGIFIQLDVGSPP